MHTIKEASLVLEPIRDDNGKLLFKWDRDTMVMEIQKNNRPSYFKFNKDGTIKKMERVIPAPDK